MNVAFVHSSQPRIKPRWLSRYKQISMCVCKACARPGCVYLTQISRVWTIEVLCISEERRKELRHNIYHQPIEAEDTSRCVGRKKKVRDNVGV
jgi:hypothetical protein